MSNSRSICHFTLPVFVATLALIAGGCAEVSFKRGGSAADFDADKLACSREIADSDQTLAGCMEKRGWFLHQFEDDSLAEEDGSGEVGTEAPATTGDGAADTPVASPAPPAKAAKKSKAKARPAVPVAIGTWFKFGAGPDAIAQDQQACVQSLGDEHRIVPPENLVTPQMRACLKERGWFGMEKVK